ncbi:MAG: protein TonB, partial [Arcobacteraceae bacterium]
SHEVTKFNPTVKKTILQLDVIIDSSTAKDEIKKKSAIKNSKIAQEIVKKTTSVSMKQKSNLKSLFANVKTDIKKVTKDKVLNVKNSSIASRFKSKFEKEQKTKNVVLSQLSEDNENKSINNNVSIDKITDKQSPYYTKIYQLLSSRWNPTIFVNDLSAKVTIIIFNNGEFSYKFIQYSGNLGFDDQLSEFLDRETQKLYPVSPKNKTITIEIVFQSKG